MNIMAASLRPEHRLILFHCAFTCIYLPGILMLLKYNHNLYNIGSYRFMSILLILMFAELVKLLFSVLYTESAMTIKLESHFTSRTTKKWTRFVKEAVKFCVAIIVLFFVFYTIIILYGAPVFDNREETTMLSVTLTILTFVPASIHLGVDLAINIMTGAQLPKNNILIDTVRTNIIGILIGTWLGAIVIPLDWDRPWQVWPIPCMIGALVGYVLSHFITLLKTLSILKSHKKLHQ